MSAYYFSLHMIVTRSTALDTPITERRRLQALLTDLANEENQ